MQVTFSRALLALLACTSATQAMPNLIIEARADNAVNQVNAPDEAQLAQAKAQADQFLSTHQEDTAAFADSLNKAQEAAKSNGKDLDISSFLNGIDLSGIKLPDLNATGSDDTSDKDDAKDDAAKDDDTKDDDTKAAKPPAWPYPGTGYGYPYNNYFCYYYPSLCQGGSTVNPYLCYYYPQLCYGSGGYPYGGGYWNPYGLKPYDGKTSCGDLGDTDAEHYGFICNDAADTIQYCTVNPSGSFDYKKCEHKGSCAAKDDGSFALCLFG